VKSHELFWPPLQAQYPLYSNHRWTILHCLTIDEIINLVIGNICIQQACITSKSFTPFILPLEILKRNYSMLRSLYSNGLLFIPPWKALLKQSLHFYTHIKFSANTWRWNYRYKIQSKSYLKAYTVKKKPLSFRRFACFWYFNFNFIKFKWIRKQWVCLSFWFSKIWCFFISIDMQTFAFVHYIFSIHHHLGIFCTMLYNSSRSPIWYSMSQYEYKYKCELPHPRGWPHFL
jgi:hypothetical protein